MDRAGRLGASYDKARLMGNPHDNAANRRRDPYRQDRPSRFAILFRRLRRVAPQIFFVSVLFGVIAGCGLLFFQQVTRGQSDTIGAWLQNHTLLPINHIEVEGAHLTTEAEIEQALGAARGKPIFSFSISDAQKRLNKLLFVSKVTVQRRMPDTVRVVIEERDPMAIWQVHGKFWLINREGDKLADAFEFRDHIKAFKSLPFVVGEGANEAAAQFVDIVAQFPEIKPFIAASIRVGKRRWTLLLKDETRIELPEGHDQAALRRLTQYQQRYRLLERPVAVIDMRLPDKMVIRLRSDLNMTPPGKGKAIEKSRAADVKATHPSIRNSMPQSANAGDSRSETIDAARQDKPRDLTANDHLNALPQ